MIPPIFIKHLLQASMLLDASRSWNGVVRLPPCLCGADPPTLRLAAQVVQPSADVPVLPGPGRWLQGLSEPLRRSQSLGHLVVQFKSSPQSCFCLEAIEFMLSS